MKGAAYLDWLRAGQQQLSGLADKPPSRIKEKDGKRIQEDEKGRYEPGDWPCRR